MSTAKWGGVKLRDVLKECGMDVDALALGEIMPEGGVQHVQAEGYDIDETGYSYGGSFPIEKAFDGLGEVILAYEMNGEELPRDHGYPVRLIIPGHVGARQVKWLHKLRLSDQVGGFAFFRGSARFASLTHSSSKLKPSKKSFQCKSYRGFAPNITFQKGKHFPVRDPSRLLCKHSHTFSLPVFVCLFDRPRRVASRAPRSSTNHSRATSDLVRVQSPAKLRHGC
jgi:hypothetical protein